LHPASLSDRPPTTEIPEVDRGDLRYREIDQHVKVVDVLAGNKRDLTATRRLFTRPLAHAQRPVEVTTIERPPTCGCSMS
jgi:hypothetical protein